MVKDKQSENDSAIIVKDLKNQQIEKIIALKQSLRKNRRTLKNNIGMSNEQELQLRNDNYMMSPTPLVFPSKHAVLTNYK